jgi:hypothetical protein
MLNTEGPKYNGPHTCPRCGVESTWTARGDASGDKDTEPDATMIRVQCSGDCGEYVMSYLQLSAGEYFTGSRAAGPS